MDLQLVKDNFLAWEIPEFSKSRGLPFREPPAGYPENPMDFNKTRGGLYGLPKPMQTLDWMAMQTKFGEADAVDKTEEYTKEMENSFCWNNPTLGAQDEGRECPDPSSASMSVSKKVAVSAHNSTFFRFSFCLSWTAINKDNKRVVTNPAHKEMSIPYNYGACAKIFRPIVIQQRLKWVCGAADPMPWTPSASDQSSNFDTDPNPFIIGAAESPAKEPSEFCAHGSVMRDANNKISYSPKCEPGGLHVWRPNSDVKKSCMKQRGSKYRCYKVPKYVCFPGGKRVEIIENGVPKYTVPTKWVNDMSKPIEKAVTKYGVTKMVHQKDENGALMYKKKKQVETMEVAGGVEDCLETVEKVVPYENATHRWEKKEMVQGIIDNNWCRNTCIDKDEIAKVIAQTEILKKTSLAENASFALIKLEMVDRKTVLEEKYEETEKLNETARNESELDERIANLTSKYYASKVMAKRIEYAKAVQKAQEEKDAHESRGKLAAKQLVNITLHEESLVKEKQQKNRAILRAYAARKARMLATAQRWTDAVEKLKMLREKAARTIAGWPAWVKSRYYKIEALATGACMFPAKCEGKFFSAPAVLQEVDKGQRNRQQHAASAAQDAMKALDQNGDNVLTLEEFTAGGKTDIEFNAADTDGSGLVDLTELAAGLELITSMSGVAHILEKHRPEVYKSAVEWLNANEQPWKGAQPSSAKHWFASQERDLTGVKSVLVPGSFFLTSADFCEKEEEAGLYEKMDVMRLCEQQGYQRESRCCTATTLTFANEMPQYVLDNYMVGAEKPWADSVSRSRRKFAASDMSATFKCDEKAAMSKSGKYTCGKLSEDTKKEAHHMLHGRYDKEHGMFVKYPMTPFKVRQEIDFLKDF
jgi:hypothetical protein